MGQEMGIECTTIPEPLRNKWTRLAHFANPDLTDQFPSLDKTPRQFICRLGAWHPQITIAERFSEPLLDG
jgi:hypothetical protein